jgi:hypothetical protein
MRDKTLAEIVAESQARVDREKRRNARLNALGIDNRSRYVIDELLDMIDYYRGEN